MTQLQDTICAIATPLGMGGIAIVRISGSDAEAIVSRLADAGNGKPVSAWESHKLYLCDLHRAADKSHLLDRALVTVMRAPRSYTGETVAEFQCHGGWFVASELLKELLLCGARMAEPGEFTRRAFLNGKTDLTAAEATLDVIDASSEAGLSNAAATLTGALAKKINALRGRVLELTSHLSAAADYPEEVDPLAPSEILSRLEALQSEIQSLLQSFQTGKILQEGIRTVIVGQPNVGKSSLLNALSESDRAIVTDIPGTTRDVLEECIHIGGGMLRLLDTAGIRTEEDADEVERIGIRKTMEQLETADLCLWLIDGSRPLLENDRLLAKTLQEQRILLLLNKSDLGTEVSPIDASEAFGIPTEQIFVTALPKEGAPAGLDAVKEKIRTMFLQGTVQTGGVVLTNARQRDALLKALSALRKGMETAACALPCDLLFIDLEDVLSALGEVTGETVQDEIIDRVFSRFCVGK